MQSHDSNIKATIPVFSFSLRTCQLIPNRCDFRQKRETECKTKWKWLTAPTKMSSNRQNGGQKLDDWEIETLNLNFNTKTSHQSKIQSSVNVSQQDILRTCHILFLKTKCASILLLQKYNAKRLPVGKVNPSSPTTCVKSFNECPSMLWKSFFGRF